MSRPITPTERIGYRRLPPARLATVLHRGPYGGGPEVTRRLRKWVEAGGMVPAGPLRILYLQFGAEPELRIPRGVVVASSSDFVTEIQLPVE